MAALAKFADRAEELHNIECEFTCHRTVPVSDNRVATHLFRIAQKDVTNSVKH